MPKVTKYPRLRTKVYRGVAGQVYVYYTYDMRPDGKPDIRLGTDREQALAKWDDLHNKRPMMAGTIEEAFTRWEEKELPQYENRETQRGYLKGLKQLRKVFGACSWDGIGLPELRRYLDLREGKTQGNREMSLFSIIWGKALLWGMTRTGWPGQGIKNWKNKEQAREFEVTDQLFEAVYSKADRVLRDCMDIATATGMRITDARTVRMPKDGLIRFKSGKAGKWGSFEVAQSPVLTDLLKRREAMGAHTVMLLASDAGRPVTYAMLRGRWDKARDAAENAALEAGDRELAAQIREMILRDMRKRAADLADDMDEASRLLQHSSKALTAKHYRTKAERLKSVR